MQWYEKLFANYGKTYDKEPFTKGTLGECDFIEAEIGFNKDIKILDVGCGTGRHTIELTKRGYNVVGIDLSLSQLAQAKQKASEIGLDIDFRHMDARNLPFSAEFDLAVMLCEGGFPLMETDEMNFEILKSVGKALKDKSKFIFTTLNGFFPIFNSINRFHESGETTEGASYISANFDLMTMRDYNTTTFTDDEGQEHSIECNERYYLPSEISWLLKNLDFSKIEFFGAKLGAFSRTDKLGTDDFEMLVVARKQR